MVYRLLNSGDQALLQAAFDGLFDCDVQPDLSARFLSDPRHHIAVAIKDSLVVGFATAVNYIHPDKPEELWTDEVGASAARCGRGAAEALLKSLLECGRELGCGEAWVLTETPNIPANGLYSKLGGAPQQQAMYSFELGVHGSE